MGSARIAHAVPANNVGNPTNATLQGKTILAHLFQNQPLKQQACVIFKRIYLFRLFFRSARLRSRRIIAVARRKFLLLLMRP